VNPCCAVRWPIPPPEGKAGNAGRSDDAAGRHEAVGLARRVEIEPGRAAARVRDPGIAVYVDTAHQRQIDHEPVVAHAVPSGVVPAAAHGDFQRLRPCEVEGGRDVAGAEAPHDEGRPAIDEGVEAAARCVVSGIGWTDDSPCQGLAQLRDDLVRQRGGTQRPPIRDVVHRVSMPRAALLSRLALQEIRHEPSVRPGPSSHEHRRALCRWSGSVPTPSSRPE
jgi:hypothetical protein